MLQAISPIIGLLLNAFVQVAGVRFIARLSLLKSLYLGFIAGFGVVIIIEFACFWDPTSWAKDSFPYLVANLIIYSSLAYNYFHFVNMGETARRIRIIRELYESKGGLTMEEILERYNAKDMVRKRMDK